MDLQKQSICHFESLVLVEHSASIWPDPFLFELGKTFSLQEAMAGVMCF